MASMRTCTRCGSTTDIYRKLMEVSGGGFNPLPGARSIYFGGRIWVHVCGSCGHLEFSVPDEYLAKVREEFERVS